MSEYVEHEPAEPSGWVGWVWFAAMLLLMVGIFNIILGLIALFDDEQLVVTGAGLVVFDITGWGWFHLIFGIIQILAALALFRGATWARIVASILVVLNAVGQVAFLSSSPVWSLLIIALDVLILWALIVHGAEARVYSGPRR